MSLYKTKRIHVDPRIRYGYVRVAIQNVRPGDIVHTEDGKFECASVVHNVNGWNVVYVGGSTSGSKRRGFSIAVTFPRPGSDRNGKPTNP